MTRVFEGRQSRVYMNGQMIGIAEGFTFDTPDVDPTTVVGGLPTLRIGRMIQATPPPVTPQPATIPAATVEQWLTGIMEAVNRLESRYTLLAAYLSLPPQAEELLVAAMKTPRNRDVLSVLADYLEEQQHEAAGRVRRLTQAPEGE